MPTAPRIAEVQAEIDRLSQASGTVEDLMWQIVRLLHERMLKYNWVGFYMLEEKPVSAAGSRCVRIRDRSRGNLRPRQRRDGGPLEDHEIIAIEQSARLSASRRLVPGCSVR